MRRVRASIFVLPLILAGCAVTPEPFTEDALRQVLEADRQAIEASVEVITEAVSLEEAIARALKHNLDHRTRLLEQSLAAGQLEAGRFDVLPRLLATAGYSWRDEDATRRSTSSTEPSISSEKQRPTADLAFSWSVLDFGVSYYTSLQNADRVLIASERRRRAMHNLIQSVRTTYWRALASQQLRDEVRSTIDEAEVALADSRRVLAAQVRSPAEPLRYQRNLLENLRLLENVDRELAAAETELAALMGVRPGVRILLIEPEVRDFPQLSPDIERMEEVALLNNADLREHVYSARIAARETRKALLKMLPNFSFDAAVKYDGDKFLVHNTWNEAAVKVGFNLFNLISGPAQIRAAEQDLSVAEARRMAMQMAVLTQVHLARHQYDDALRQYHRAVDIYDVDRQLADLARGQEQAQMGGSLERISANVTEILSSVRLYHALARVNEAASRVQASLGIDPVADSLDDLPLDDLSLRIGQTLREWL